MPTDFDVTVRLNIPRDILWRVRASRSFMKFLVENGALQRMEATVAIPSSVCSSSDEDDNVHNNDKNNPHSSSSTTSAAKNAKKKKREYQRRQTYVPGDVVIPEMVKTIIDESYIEIGDDQTWDENKPYTQQSVIRPTILGDMILTKARLSLLEVEDGNDEVGEDEQCEQCLHSLSGQVSASIMFLGYYVEQAVVTNMKSFYANYAAHIDDFVEMVVKKYGDGRRSSLNEAVDKMLAEEEKASA